MWQGSQHPPDLSGKEDRTAGQSNNRGNGVKAGTVLLGQGGGQGDKVGTQWL